MVAMWNALGTPRRREILRQVWDREYCVGDICRVNPDITMGAVSQHLRVLENAGLVLQRQDGVRRFYIARKDELGPLRDWLENMWNESLYRLKLRAEIEQARRGPRQNKRRRNR